MKTGQSRIDSVLSQVVASGHIANVVAMAANENELLYSGAYGLLDSKRNIELNSIFWIASMTKAITSVAAMQLVEEGMLDLDEPVQNHLPQMKELGVLEGISEKKNKLILSKQHTPVTLKHLLTHTAGFGYGFFDPLLNEASKENLIPRPLDDQPPFVTTPLRFQPGTKWIYGTSTAWLGMLIEKVRGQRLDQVFRDYIFMPLAMNDTHFYLSDDKIDRLVHPRKRNLDGSINLKELNHSEPTFFSGGGGLYTTAPNYIRFLRALLGFGELDGNRILSPAMVRLMGSNHTGSKEIGPLESQDLDFSNQADLYPGGKNGFGLGFFVHGKPVPDGRAAGSLFWAGIMNTYFWIDHAKSVCGVFLTQMLPFYDKITMDTLGQFEKAVYECIWRDPE